MASLSLKKIGFLTPLAVLVLILVLADVLLTFITQSLRQQVSEHQQVLGQSVQMEAVYREIVTAIATVAVTRNDPELKSLLTSQGINLDSDSKAPGGAK
jgi:hypothetical protein